MFLFAIGAALNILLALITPELLKLCGNRKLFAVLVGIAMVSTFGLALSPSASVAATLFLIYATVASAVSYGLDIFLEAVSRDSKTGEIRGIFLTLGNLAIAIAPLVVSIIAPSGQFSPLYLVSSFILVPLFSLSIFGLHSFKDTADYQLQSLRLPFKKWWKNKDLRNVTFARGVLEFFYVIMIIYTPIYLSQEIGFEWDTIGLIFTIMVLPFVLFELPAGEFADKKCGEKEIMTVGFFITGFSLLFMPFIGPNPALWAFLLFMSRVGAALIEAMTDVYFFKKVKRKDTSMIAIFRLTRPVPIIFGSIAGVFFATSLSFSAIFLMLAAAVFLGMFASSHIKDTL